MVSDFGRVKTEKSSFTFVVLFKTIEIFQGSHLICKFDFMLVLAEPSVYAS